MAVIGLAAMKVRWDWEGPPFGENGWWARHKINSGVLPKIPFGGFVLGKTVYAEKSQENTEAETAKRKGRFVWTLKRKKIIFE